jgi:hypothetical protein
MRHCQCVIANASLPMRHCKCVIANASLPMRHCKCVIANAPLLMLVNASLPMPVFLFRKDIKLTNCLSANDFCVAQRRSKLEEN